MSSFRRSSSLCERSSEDSRNSRCMKACFLWLVQFLSFNLTDWHTQTHIITPLGSAWHTCSVCVCVFLSQAISPGLMFNYLPSMPWCRGTALCLMGCEKRHTHTHRLTHKIWARTFRHMLTHSVTHAHTHTRSVWLISAISLSTVQSCVFSRLVSLWWRRVTVYCDTHTHQTRSQTNNYTYAKQ